MLLKLSIFICNLKSNSFITYLHLNSKMTKDTFKKEIPKEIGIWNRGENSFKSKEKLYRTKSLVIVL